MVETNRSDIRDAFLTELTNAAATTHSTSDGTGNTVTTTVEASDISLLNKASFEDVPAVVYDDEHEIRSMNGVGNGPNTKTYSGSNVDYVTHHEYVRSTFRVTVRASSETLKEPVYEAVRRAFGIYDDGWESSRSFHDAVFNIDVTASTSADSLVEDPIRGETLTVVVDWHRDYERVEDTIETVEAEADADTDSNTAGENYTIQ
jgi:hypothetical protein